MNKQKMINFTSLRTPALIFSILLIIVSLGALFTKGLNMGVDFTGGTVIEIGYPEATEVEPIRTALTAAGYDAQVQHFGSAKDVLIRITPPKDALETKSEKDKIAKK